jgi:crossover junction endodeoxyribonuclease RuvC
MSFAKLLRRFCLKRREKKEGKVLVMGIDPGSRSLGYGIVETDGYGFRYVTSGRLVPGPKSPLYIRLKDIFEGLSEVINEFGPSEVVVEKVFFAKSPRSALSLGQARGVALLAAASAGIDVHEYGALAVKKAVTGYGRAEKSQVQKMVKNMLDIKTALSPDGADALALAICHINTISYGKTVGLR